MKNREGSEGGRGEGKRTGTAEYAGHFHEFDTVGIAMSVFTLCSSSEKAAGHVSEKSRVNIPKGVAQDSGFWYDMVSASGKEKGRGSRW